MEWKELVITIVQFAGIFLAFLTMLFLLSHDELIEQPDCSTFTIWEYEERQIPVRCMEYYRENILQEETQ